MRTGNGLHAERFTTPQRYTTMDAYVSGFLCIQGFIPELVQEGPKVVFSFASSPSLLKAIARYNAGELVSASQLALATKALKSQIHSLKMNKGASNGYGQHNPR